jgi:cell division FtsZ-interacting protein ZapD
MKQDDLTRLRVEEETGLKIQSLKSNEGWKVLEEEIQKMLEAIRRQAVSKDSLDLSTHATYVGAHSALQSLLDLLSGFEDRARVSSKRIKEIETQQKEDRKLGIQTRI